MCGEGITPHGTTNESGVVVMGTLAFNMVSNVVAVMGVSKAFHGNHVLYTPMPYH